MSSKSADDAQRVAGRAENGKRWSLTLWLTIFNAGSAFLILAFISYLLYLGLAHQLENENHFYLQDEIDSVEKILRSHGVGELLVGELGPEHAGDEYVKHYIRVTDRDGRTLAESPNMKKIVVPESMKFPVREWAGRAREVSWQSTNGDRLIGKSLWVPVGKAGEEVVLQAALDVTNVSRILVGYRNKIDLALAVGLALCVGVSYSVARKGTRPLREMTEVVSGISVSNLDARITCQGGTRELNALAAALNEMLFRLHDSFQRLYVSATNLSHKMRTPLTILRGEAEIALSRNRSAEELRDVIASSLEENDRLLRLIENILFLANAEMGKFVPQPAALELREELEKVIDFYTPAAEEKGISISCDGTACALADASLFRQVVAALISNGLTYNAPGGRIDLVLSRPDALHAQLSISDSGCGIPEADHEKVFDRFYRIYATRYMDPHGTGLGLCIAKAATQLNKGSIKLESSPGDGTTVTVTFPVPSA